MLESEFELLGKTTVGHQNQANHLNLNLARTNLSRHPGRALCRRPRCAASKIGRRQSTRKQVVNGRSDTRWRRNRRWVDINQREAYAQYRMPLLGKVGQALDLAMRSKPDRKIDARGSEMRDTNDSKPADFEKAVALYPKYADAWVSLAKLRLQQQAVDPARAALRKAMESDPKLVTPYLELGLLAAKEQPPRGRTSPAYMIFAGSLQATV